MTIKELKEKLDKYPDDTIVVKEYPEHWFGECQELTEDNLDFTFVNEITDDIGKKIKGKFLILYRTFGYNY